MHEFASQVLKVSLNGLSLTVVSFTIVFLFHGVGGGLYCGTVLFRLSHFASKTQNMEVLTTLLVILTIIQPFICLHPVIIWAQDSQKNSNFLLLIIMIWFLPLGIHIVMKAIMNQGVEKCSKKDEEERGPPPESGSFHQKNKKVILPKVDTGRKRRIQVEEVRLFSLFKKNFLAFRELRKVAFQMYKGCLKLLVQIISLVSRIFFVFFKKPKLLLFRAVLFFL